MGKKGGVSFTVEHLAASVIIIFLLSSSAYGLGDYHLYSMPGVWAEDVPTGWMIQQHVRFIEYNKMFDDKSSKKNLDEVLGPSRISAGMLITKIGYAKRLWGEKSPWQLTNVLIVTAADIKMNHDGIKDQSASGMADLMSAHYFGRHFFNRMFHIGIGLCLSAPTADYDKNDPVNLGLNYWKIYPGILMHARIPLGNGLLMIDYGSNIEFRTKNHDTNWDDHDLTEHNFIFTYYTDMSMKYGFFVQPDFQFAINESELNDKKQNDGDFYTIGGAIGLQYNPKPNLIFYFKYSQELDGRNAPVIKAGHFMMTYLF